MSFPSSLIRVCYVRVEEYPDGLHYTVVTVANINDRSTEHEQHCRDLSETLNMVEAFLRRPR